MIVDTSESAQVNTKDAVLKKEKAGRQRQHDVPPRICAKNNPAIPLNRALLHRRTFSYHCLQTLPPPPELPAASRASYYLHSLRPPPELPAASKASCLLPLSLRPPPEPPASSREPSTASRASRCLQSFVLAASEPSTSSRASDLLQTFRPPPELATPLELAISFHATAPLDLPACMLAHPPDLQTYTPSRPPDLASIPPQPPYLCGFILA